MATDIGALVLAAGGSKRLGRPKQLIEYQGKTLVRRATEAALQAGCDPVVVVLGADVEMIEPELASVPVIVVHNPRWSTGMGSSIVAGTLRLATAAIDALLITLCDQPDVDAAVLTRLIECYRTTGATIVAAEYDDTRGVPAIFPRRFFEALASLQGAHGARRIIADNPQSVVAIPVPEAAWDIDTRADLGRWV